MKEILVDGERYVRSQRCGDIKIVVLERGFVYVGRYRDDGSTVTIMNARAIIRWGTSAHLGELSNGPLENTKLGQACMVRAQLSQVIHTIEVSQDDWNKHIG